jgi:aromatic-L-amino-acid decarboxylase
MTLDPKDWGAFRAAAHIMLDASIDKLAHVGDGRVWTPLPDAQKSSIQSDLPVKGTNTTEMQKQLESFLPYGVGNTHPRFFGWVHGAGAPSGLMAEIAAAAMNVNAGGRDHVAPVVERQVIAWSAEMMGLPADTSGLIVSGTSMATIIALKVARDQAMDRTQGQLVGYTSAQTHSCVAQAFDILGLGRDHLRKITCNAALEMDIDALQTAIAADKAAGFVPFLIVGTAGAVNMGAIDDLEGLADIAKTEGMWLHIDGAFGATAVIGQHARARLTGLARADSLAFDFHKWLQVNYDAGCVLIRDEAAHRGAFSDRPEYLRGSERGLAGGAFWAVDYGPELSRGFRALKVWAHLKEHGVEALASVIDRNIEQAQYLENLVKTSPKLEMLAPVPLNICCFRYKFENDSDALNEEIVVQLQESGIAVPSTTIINGQLAIRVNLTNHRTQYSDLDTLVDAVLGAGDALA